MLSDRNSDDVYAPIPSLLLTSAVHHHLIREKKRTKVGLIVECGDAREVHHMALLIGYGAGAINPYLAFESIEDMVREDLHGLGGIDPHKAVKNYIKAAGKGVLKVMSKMGVSTVASYTGAQIFEAIGLGHELVDEYFTGTVSRLGGIGLDEVAAEVAARHKVAHPPRPGRAGPPQARARWRVPVAPRGRGAPVQPGDRVQAAARHAVQALRHLQAVHRAGRRPGQEAGDAARPVRLQARRHAQPVPIDEVEPVSEIVKRFSTGAMSYGSICAEAHETLAIAMNSIGGKSNTGEGGEDSDRLYDPQRRSAIKQVASGRFGVTSEYLVNATDLQIKMAQGAKPGEGGQLPGHKVYPWIAATRHSTPGVGLISPPPHHDIYSIEDLKQLIHDLKNSNPAARVNVKLVAEVGVGTVAAGVSKAKADVVLISGHDGGTGASPLTSLKHAGAPWELGLAETQQTLLLNGLRDRIVVQADGQLKTGRDVVIAALLGAEEFGFATAPLVVSGCVMMRVCHLDTCPVGVATQNPELRAKFSGKPEFVVNFMEYIAEEVREHMAALGFRTMEEMIGHVEVLDTKAAITHWKAKGLDISPILAAPAEPVRADDVSVRRPGSRARARARPAAARGVRAGDRARRAGASSSSRSTTSTAPSAPCWATRSPSRYGGAGLPDGTIDIHFRGSAGQSFGAFVPSGHHAATRRRRQRLRRQGPVGRTGRRAARPARPVRRRGAHDRRQRDRLRRDRWRDLPARCRRRAVLRSQLGRDRGGRGRRRSRLRVHDRRARRRARPDGSQLRCGHERWHRLRLRPRTMCSPPRSTARWCNCNNLTTTIASFVRDDRAGPLRPHRLGRCCCDHRRLGAPRSLTSRR